MPNANRRGFALPAAIGALVIVGVLVTAGFYMARQELRIGVASRHSSMAVDVAQSSINSVLVNHTQALTPLVNWGDTTLVDTADVGVTRVHVTRLAQRLFYLDATTRITEGGALWSGATRRVGVVTRLSSANMEPPAALTTQGSVKVGGASMVNGYDSIPSTWGGACDISSLKNKPGLMIDDSTQITTTGGKFDVYGNPAVEQDPTINSATLLDFGDFTWEDLVGLAQITYPVGTTTLTSIQPDSTSVGGSYVCRQTTQSNWGDPRSLVGVCSNYFPIIYSAGDMSISGGYGQGILLVEGNLKVDGGFEFYGPVYVKGQLSTQGTGGHFNGGVVAANVDLGTSTVLGNALVSFSSCAVSRAVLNNSALTKVRPLAMRSWMDLSNVMN